jgi:hypothetical protein
LGCQESLNDVQKKLGKLPLYVTGGTFGAVIGGVLFK